MSSLLVLLVLLSVATLASRRGSFDKMMTSGATPILVALGAVIAPAGLGFLPPSVLQGLLPAVDVGVLWLAMLAGVRASGTLERTGMVRGAVAASGVTALVASAVTLVVLRGSATLGSPLVDDLHVLPASVLVGVALACTPARPGGRASTARARFVQAAVAELLALAAAVSVLAVWSDGSRAAATVGLGVLGAAIAYLLAAQTGLAPVVAVLAAGTLLAGLSALAHLPGAVAGFIAGTLSARTRDLSSLSSWLFATERPVRVVVTVVVAASAGVDLFHLLPGAILGLVAVGVLVGANLLLVDDAPRLDRLAATVAMSTTPMVVVASFAHIDVAPAQSLLPVVLVAVSVADAAAFTLSLWARSNRRRGVT